MSYAEEVLVTKSELEEKKQRMSELETQASLPFKFSYCLLGIPLVNAVHLQMPKIHFAKDWYSKCLIKETLYQNNLHVRTRK